MDQREVWENIGKDWDRYRQHPSREIKEFLASKDGLILDVACGSGRNFLNDRMIGIDFSEKMLRFAKKNSKLPLVLGNIESLPFSDGVFDSIIFIASLHCVKFNRHDKVLSEVKRVAKDGATILITVWNKDQPRFAKSKKETFVPWKSHRKTYNRYYYLYSADELEAALKKHFSGVRVFGGSALAQGRYPKDLMATVKVRKN
jgi:ubiquinone/menaquinone biosynthesis C-methylase UbiE